MKFLIVPDSFKGSLEAKRVCRILSEEIFDKFPNAIVKTYPAFDGGEGSVENLTDIKGGKLVSCKVKDGNFYEKESRFGVFGDCAVIAVANSSGLPDTKIKDPKITTTYGFGEEIKKAVEMGVKTVYLALGGSSTNDGGAGAAVALGGKFYDKTGKEFIPTGGTLGQIDKVDLIALKEKINGVKFVAMCDVKNPLTGENGCSHIYAKQKGATEKADRDELEENMLCFAEKTSFLGVSKDTQGAGAAGGLGYFVKAFLNGELVSGADFFLDAIEYENECLDADYVICGEGKFDATSDSGKICGRIIARASNVGKKTTVFCGIAEKTDGDGINKVYEISDKTKDLNYNMKNAEINLRLSARKFIRDIS